MDQGKITLHQRLLQELEAEDTAKTDTPGHDSPISRPGSLEDDHLHPAPAVARPLHEVHNRAAANLDVKIQSVPLGLNRPFTIFDRPSMDDKERTLGLHDRTKDWTAEELLRFEQSQQRNHAAPPGIFVRQDCQPRDELRLNLQALTEGGHPDTAALHGSTSGTQPAGLLFVAGTLDGLPTRTLIDTASTCSIVSTSWLARSGISAPQRFSASISTHTATGVATHDFVDLSPSLQLAFTTLDGTLQTVGSTRFMVMSLPEGVDLLLGLPFLTSPTIQPVVDVHRGAMWFTGVDDGEHAAALLPAAPDTSPSSPGRAAHPSSPDDGDDGDGRGCSAAQASTLSNSASGSSNSAPPASTTTTGSSAQGSDASMDPADAAQASTHSDNDGGSSNSASPPSTITTTATGPSAQGPEAGMDQAASTNSDDTLPGFVADPGTDPGGIHLTLDRDQAVLLGKDPELCQSGQAAARQLRAELKALADGDPAAIELEVYSVDISFSPTPEQAKRIAASIFSTRTFLPHSAAAAQRLLHHFAPVSASGVSTTPTPGPAPAPAATAARTSTTATSSHARPAAPCPSEKQQKLIDAVVTTEEPFRTQIVDALVRQHEVCVSELPDQPPPSRGPHDAHVTFTPQATSVRAARYKMTANEQAIMEYKVRSLLAKGYWRPGCPEMCVTAMLVKKPHAPKPNSNDDIATQAASYRLVQDWRRVNSQILPVPNSLSRFDELCARLGQASVYSSVDMKSSFDLVRVSPELFNRVGVLAGQRTYRMTVMAQGFVNATSIFSSLMDAVLAGELDTSSHNSVDPDHPLDLRAIVVSYVDDLVVLSASLQEHAKHLELVLARLRDNHLYINIDKISAASRTCDFLGFTFGEGYCTVPPDRTSAMLKVPMPVNVTEMRGWLGRTNFLRQFVKNYPRLSQLQYASLSAHGTKLQRTPELVAEFEALRAAFAELPRLMLPDSRLMYYLCTDASKSGLGATLFQRQPSCGKLGPVGYWSRTLAPHEKNWSINELETVAARDAMVHFSYYLRSSTAPFILLTDSSFLKQVVTTADLSSRHRRILEAFHDFNFLTYHISGKDMALTDLLSRSQMEQPAPSAQDHQDIDAFIHCCRLEVERHASRSVAQVFMITRAQAKQQLADSLESTARTTQPSVLSPVTVTSAAASTTTAAQASSPSVVAAPRSALASLNTEVVGGSDNTVAVNKTSKPPPSFLVENLVPVEELLALPPDLHARVVKSYETDALAQTILLTQDVQHHTKRRYAVHNGIIYFSLAGSSLPALIYIPEGGVRDEVLRRFHSSGHAGVTTMLAKLQMYFWWPHMQQSVRVYILDCEACALNKPARQLQGFYQPSVPGLDFFEHIQIDMITSLPPVNLHGSIRDRIFVIFDASSHTILLEPTSQHVTGAEVFDILRRRILTPFGPRSIKRIMADHDVAYGKDLTDQLKLHGIDIRYTTTNHSRSNGGVEKANGIVEQHLKHCVAVNQADWAALLPATEAAINNRYVAAIGMTPHYFIFGREYRDIAAATAQHSAPSLLPAQDIERRGKARRDALLNKLSQQELTARHFNLQHDVSTFKPGQLVRVKAHVLADPDAKVQTSDKLAARWSGPHKVLSVVHPGAYYIDLPTSSRANHIVSIQHLQAWTPSVDIDAQEEEAKLASNFGNRWNLQAIVAHRPLRNRYSFLVRWQGFGRSESSWLSASHLVDEDNINMLFERYVRFNNLPIELLDYRINSKVKFVADPAAVLQQLEGHNVIVPQHSVSINSTST